MSDGATPNESRDHGRARAIDVCQTATMGVVIAAAPGVPAAEMVVQYQLRPQYGKLVGGPRWVRYQARGWWSWRCSHDGGMGGVA